VPRDELCDRPWVIIHTGRLNHIHMLGDKYALCLAGAGIFDLSVEAAKVGRESHSVLGSMFLNPSVAAGVSFGSGGTQMRKGPAYTDRALWCKVDENGNVSIINTLGLMSGNTLHSSESTAEFLQKIEQGGFHEADVKTTGLAASDAERYKSDICVLNSDVSRFNADTRGLEPNRSEGKVFILATLHETFARPSSSSSFWVSCDHLETAQSFKQQVLLQSSTDLPISCEYMDRDSFDVIDRSGRGLCMAIRVLGMGHRLTQLWNLKLSIEALPLPLADTICDYFLHLVSPLLPSPLPRALQKLGREKNHHMLIDVGEFGTGELARFQERLTQYQEVHGDAMTVYPCRQEERAGVNHFRFAAAPAFRTWCVGRGVQGVSIDYALPKNFITNPDLAALGENQPLTRMRYSHFGCNVVHEDITFAQGVDVEACKMSIKKVVEGIGGKLPAEHGHGTEYVAPAETQQRWREMDPCNVMNPGVGGTEYDRHYCCSHVAPGRLHVNAP